MIARKTFSIFPSRSISCQTLNLFKGGPVTFNLTLADDIDLTGCTLLQLDIRESFIDSNPALLTDTIPNPTGTTFSFAFSTTEMDFDVSTAVLVISAYYPGATSADDNIDPLYIANLNIVLHNAYSV